MAPFTVFFIAAVTLICCACVRGNLKGLSDAEQAWMAKQAAERAGRRVQDAQAPKGPISQKNPLLKRPESLSLSPAAAPGAAANAAAVRRKGNQRQQPHKNVHVVELTAAEFERQLARVPHGIVVWAQFYANWCNHCKKLAPIWEQVAALYKDDPRVVIARINGDIARDLMARSSVTGFPNMVLYSKHTLPSGELYRGERTFERLSEWLRNRVGAPVTLESAVRAQGTEAYHGRLERYNELHHRKRKTHGDGDGDTASTAGVAAPASTTTATRAAASSNAEAAPVAAGPFPSTDEGVFHGEGGVPLYYQCWEVETSAERRVLVLVHGIGAHGGLYQTLVDFVYPRGYAVYALDLRGHGRSSGARGHVDAWSDLRGDMRQFMEFVKEREGVESVFVVGHDTGALLALQVALGAPRAVRAAVLLAPQLEPLDGGGGGGGDDTQPGLLHSALCAVWPQMPASLARAPEQLAGSAAFRERLDADMHYHTTATVGFQSQYRSALGEASEFGASVRVPVLVMHGDNDTIAPVLVAERFCAASDVCRFELVAAGRHWFWEDVGEGRIDSPPPLNTLVSWLNER